MATTQSPIGASIAPGLPTMGWGASPPGVMTTGAACLPACRRRRIDRRGGQQ
jgi:hypothetical protein